MGAKSLWNVEKAIQIHLSRYYYTDISWLPPLISHSFIIMALLVHRTLFYSLTVLDKVLYLSYKIFHFSKPSSSTSVLTYIKFIQIFCWMTLIILWKLNFNLTWISNWMILNLAEVSTGWPLNLQTWLFTLLYLLKDDKLTKLNPLNDFYP